MTPRLPTVDDGDDLPPEAARLFAGAAELLAFVSNFARTVAHAPALARWVVPMIAAIQRGGPDAALGPRIKELAILKTSTLNQCLF